MYETDLLLREITGMDKFSLAPFAGAHGELVGLWIIKKYHELRKDFKRTKIIIPIVLMVQTQQVLLLQDLMF